MSPQWPVPALHAILVGGLPLFHEYEAYAAIYPGYVVAYTGVVNPVLIAGCDSGATARDDPVGVAVLAMADQEGHGSWRKPNCTGAGEATRDLPYEAGDQVKVVSGDVFVMLILDQNETLVPGDKVMCSDANPGLVIEYFCSTTADPCELVAESMEVVTTGTSECEYFLAKLLI